MRLIYLTVLFITFQSTICRNQRNSQMLGARINFFDIELLQAVAEKEGNVMVSPASVKSTLAMILAGAEGDTATEIEEALRATSKDELKEQLILYLNALQANSTGVVLESANTIFISNQLKLYPRYDAVIKMGFKSEVVSTDFKEPKNAASIINNWVNGITHGLIPSIVDPAHITPLTDLVITNALYFKSLWLNTFDPLETESSCFYRDGDCKMAAMMFLENELNYTFVEDLKAHAVELPYQNPRYSMILLVPQTKDGITGLIRDLPFVHLPRLYKDMEPRDVTLYMPKFTVDFNVDLVESLRNMHITTLFSNKSNLSKIFEGPAAHVDHIHHKIFMSVDEKGTVAAASSAAMVVPLIYNGGVQVKADRPFLFFIKDNELGIVLFEGKIEEPIYDVPKVPDVKTEEPILQQKEPVVPLKGKPDNPAVLKTNPIVPNNVNIPSIAPAIEIRIEQPVNESTNKPATKAKGFFDIVKDFFG